MPIRSAGIVFYRRDTAGVSVLLVHPGGPFWRNRRTGAWQIPKGVIERHEDAAVAARREVAEELGVRVEDTLAFLGKVRQAGGKIVEAFAVEQDIEVASIVSNSFEREWPPRSGRMQAFPEVDEARWMTLPDAAREMLPSQRPLLAALAAYLCVPTV